jgi:hypothetical protein
MVKSMSEKKRKESFKSIRVRLIPLNEEPYKLMASIRKKHHTHIHRAKIALAWRKKYKPDRDGHLILGKCMKTSDLQRELADWDFVILLNKEVWNDPEFGSKRQKALLDHELCHAQIVLNKEGNPKRDTRKRRVWRMRNHDIEEFREIVERHGCYKKDLEEFAEALLKRRRKGR